MSLDIAGAAAPTHSRVELRKTLTLVQVVMMGLAYLQPMTIFDTFGIVSELTKGHVATGLKSNQYQIYLSNDCLSRSLYVRNVPI